MFRAALIRVLRLKDLSNTLENYSNLDGVVVFLADKRELPERWKNRWKQAAFVIIYDLTKNNIEMLKNDQVDFLIDQDGFVQGYRSLLMLANQLQNNKTVTKMRYLLI